MPAPVRQMTVPHLGFVGGLLYAIRKAGRQPPEPPEYLRCPITQVRASLRLTSAPPLAGSRRRDPTSRPTLGSSPECPHPLPRLSSPQELFTDPVILSQTGYTYDRVAIERWLRQKSPPTDPSSNVELYSTQTVPNWALRDAANEWCAANGVAPLAVPESARRTLAGGRNARDGKPHGELRGTLAGVFVAAASLVAAVRDVVVASAGADARRVFRRLGLTPTLAAHFLALFALAVCCAALSCAIVAAEGALAGLSYSAAAADAALAGPAKNLAWWAGIFTVVWLANGGFVDPVRADAERRRRLRRARGGVGLMGAHGAHGFHRR